MEIDIHIVDDEQLDRYIVRRVAARQDWPGRILEYPSGTRFLEEFGQRLGDPDAGPAHCILMGINMPGPDGFETVRRLQKLMVGLDMRPNLAVIIYSSSDAPEDRDRARASPLVCGYIPKPLNDASMEGIRRVCEFT